MVLRLTWRLLAKECRTLKIASAQSRRTRQRTAFTRKDAFDKKDIELVRQPTEGRYGERLQRIVDDTDDAAQ